MTDVFISYARSTDAQAKRVADALHALGYEVWSDEHLPAHRAYTDVIEERLNAAKAVVVIWSADAVRSEWVRSEANRARGIVLKLTDVHDGAEIWADRIDETLGDVFVLQDQVAFGVASAIEPAVKEAEMRRISHRPAGRMGSYDLYLRASALLRAWRQDETLQALDFLEQAIELDPEFATGLDGNRSISARTPCRGAGAVLACQYPQPGLHRRARIALRVPWTD